MKDGGFRAKWGGPKHKNKKRNKENKRKNKKTRKKRSPQKNNSKNAQKLAFQLSVKFFFFWGGFSKFPFFDTLAQKARTQKTL